MERNKDRDGWKRRTPASMDGIVRGGQHLGVPVHRAYQPNRQAPTPSLDNFIRRTDGFHPDRQTIRSGDRSEAEEASLLDEPIVLDDIGSRQRKPKFWRRHAKLKKALKTALVACVLIVLAGGGYFGYKFYHTQKRVLAGGGRSATVCSDSVDPSQLQTEGDSRINVLLLGIGGPGHDGPDLTDTIMLASIDPINNKVVLLSVPRDLWVSIPGYGVEKINHAYAYGKENSTAKSLVGKEQDGIGLIDKTLQNVLDVQVNYHVLVNFMAFKDAVDAVGGVTINVPSSVLNYPAGDPYELYDPTIAWENNWNPVIAKEGVQNFNGQQALLFARSRETSSDFARSDRQRLVLLALKQKVMSAGTFSNPLKISSLLDSLGNNVYTDFDSTSIKCLYHQISGIPNSAIQSLDMVTPPHALLTTGDVGDQSIVEPKAGLFNYGAIQQFVRQSLPDGLLLREGAHVAVYNATSTPGLATNEAVLLKSYGYKVTAVANAGNPTDPATTTVVDLTHGADKYTRHYLEDRFGVTATDKVPGEFNITPPPGASFVIILGNDASTPSQD